MFDLQSNLALAAFHSFSHQTPLSSDYSPYYQPNSQSNNTFFQNGFQIEGLSDMLSISITNNLPPLPHKPHLDAASPARYFPIQSQRYNPDSNYAINFKRARDSVSARKQNLQVPTRKGKDVRGKEGREKAFQDYYDTPIPFQEKSRELSAYKQIRRRKKESAETRPSWRGEKGNTPHKSIQRNNEGGSIPNGNVYQRKLTASEMDQLLQ